ncbi:amidohydrolase [Uliginosibacterium sp. H1]|uniref:amidohydrolase n=1 Tax=Uliginosibacterium sp. H1 TaxID=3114757 RepID=UPI002E18C3AD|nr:amidohydrolase [Uliginosibacterium sp. H1]
MQPSVADRPSPADSLFHNGRITTLDRSRPEVQALAVKDGKVLAAGSMEDLQPYVGPATRRIDLRGRRVIPGLNDSHTHLIRAGLNYNMELRWDGVPSLADALRMLREQAQRTPAPQWVRVVGGFSEWQFAEKRLPTLQEINEAAPDTPVFILHLYDRALLNAAALRAVGYTKDTPNPPGGEIQRDARGEPTGLLVAKPNAMILYATLAKGPRLSPEDQENSTRLYMRELNRLGITSVIDAGGGFQNYPDDYGIIRKLANAGELTVRVAYNLFTQRPKQEKDDFLQWARLVRPGDGERETAGFFRHNGAGEMLVFSAADFEDFREPRPDLSTTMEQELVEVTRVLAANRWPFRIHATYDESITRVLDVFERVNAEVPLTGLNWIIDHAETISERNIERIRALGGGIAIQHRMAYQGEYFQERYGRAATERTPPVKKMLEAGVPVGMGTDATRVASYNPWVGLQWLVTGETVGGTKLYPQASLLDRETALRLYTEGSAWFSTEQGRKGALIAGQYADFVALSADYFAIPQSDIKGLSSVLTVVGGKVVHGSDGFDELAPPLPTPSPDWSPVRYRELQAPRATAAVARTACCATPCGVHGHRHMFASQAAVPASDRNAFWGALGCGCAW